jgi:uncharacterized membrane protein YeiH
MRGWCAENSATVMTVLLVILVPLYQRGNYDIIILNIVENEIGSCGLLYFFNVLSFIYSRIVEVPFMIWDIFNYIGIAAFAISGAMMAMEETYDLFGVYVLGFVTTFGGGVIRNILIGLPASMLWEQKIAIYTALTAITITIITPMLWLRMWKRLLVLFDAIGLSAFSIQGALFAVDQRLPIHAIMVASVLTGIGGGLIRDVLAGRKPLLLKEDVYAVWSMLSGFIIGLHKEITDVELFFVFILVVTMRMISVHYQLKLPLKIVWHN